LNETLTTERLTQIIERKSKSLETIFDAIPVGLMLVDESMTVVRINNAIRKMIGKDFADIINKPVGQAINCRTTQTSNCGQDECCRSCPIRTNVMKVFQTLEAIEEFEFENQTFFNGKCPKLFFALTVKHVIIDEKNHVVVCLNDITRRKLAEEKVSESMELKQQFISTVSHELRTPLTSIREGLNIVLEGVAGKLKPKQAEFLQLSKRNVDRLSMLINDVLDFQKLDSGRMRFDFIESNMADTIKEAADTMKLMAKNSNVELAVRIDSEVGTAVFDRNRIIQVITNLLSNAIKFTPAGGKVTIVANMFNDSISISVSDTGMGIPKEDLPKIFERFYRVKRPGKEIAGTGLGLPIVSQIVNRHKGTISVESELNKGTTFVVTLPVRGPQEGLDNHKDEAIEAIIVPK